MSWLLSNNAIAPRSRRDLWRGFPAALLPSCSGRAPVRRLQAKEIGRPAYHDRTHVLSLGPLVVLQAETFIGF